MKICGTKGLTAVSKKVLEYKTSTIECLVVFAKNKDTPTPPPPSPTKSDSQDHCPRILHFKEVFRLFFHMQKKCKNLWPNTLHRGILKN